jgi:hypothetical protein
MSLTTDPFATWYAGRHGHEPDREAVQAVAWEWLEGMLPGVPAPLLERAVRAASPGA